MGLKRKQKDVNVGELSGKVTDGGGDEGAGRKEGDQNTLLAWVKMSHDKLNKIFFFEEWRKGACIQG